MSAKASDVRNKQKSAVDEVKAGTASVAEITTAPAQSAAPVPAMGAAPVPPQTSDTAADDNATGELVQAERRITPKTVMEGNITDMVLAGQLSMPCAIYSVIGRADNLRDGESDHGPWTAALGEFEATRHSDGKIFIGKECHVPGAAGELLVTELRRFIVEQEPDTAENIKKRGKRYKTTGQTVDIGIVVGIKRSSRTGGAPYEFTVASIVPIRRSDALAALRQKAMAHMATLPAPAPRASTVPTTQAALPAPDVKT